MEVTPSREPMDRLLNALWNGQDEIAASFSSLEPSVATPKTSLLSLAKLDQKELKENLELKEIKDYSDKLQLALQDCREMTDAISKQAAQDQLRF